MNEKPVKSPPSRRSMIGAVLRVTSGNFLEQFDFFLFGFYAVYIAKAFFPADSEFASLMLTFAVFGAGFLMRPLGAILLGSYVDRMGRRKGLVVTLSIMAMGTVLIAFVPSYATIGIAAPLLVLIGRLLQGFSAGVEVGGVSVYLSEIAPPGRKGFYISLQSASQQFAIIAAASIGYLINRWLNAAEIADWGWRIPFFIGCGIIPIVFMLRNSLQETEAFMARTHRPTTREIFRTVVLNWQTILTGMMLMALVTTTFYFIAVYTPTFGKAVLHLNAEDSLIVTLCVGLSNFFWVPIGGALSDRIGRRPILLVTALLAVFTSYPAMSWLADAPSFERLLAVLLWFSFFYCIYNGAMLPTLTEIMPVYVRTVGFALAYSLATAVLGGLTPAVSTALVGMTGSKSSPAWWLTFSAILGLLATLTLFRKKNTGEEPKVTKSTTDGYDTSNPFLKAEVVKQTSTT